MVTNLRHPLLTAEQFLQIDFGPDLKAELDNGVIRMMAGSTRAHARIQVNLLAAARAALRGSGCRPYGSDMAVRTHAASVRYPDMTIDCGAPDDREDDLILTDPRAIVEVLSPSTRENDLQVTMEEYRAMPSVDTIAFVDVDTEALSIHQRIEGKWTETPFQTTLDLAIPALAITIPRAEIFARD